MPAFLSPWFLLGVLGAAIPIAIHLFFRRAEPVVEFAAMRYLRQAPVEHARRRRLRELMLLVLRVMALVLLALAFARPYFTEPAAAGAAEATLVIVDVSASMSAPGRFEAAQARAADAIRGAPATHAVGVATFGQALQVIVPVSQDRAGALAAIARLKPASGATRYRAAIRDAVNALEGRGGRIVVVTDLQQSGWDAAGDARIPRDVAVQAVDVGAPGSNLAVTALRIDGPEAVAVLQSYSSGPVTSQVVFTLDDRRIGAVPLALDAGASAEARLRLDGAAAGALSASIEDDRGYAADNTRFAIIDADQAISILGITATGQASESLYLARAVGVAAGSAGLRWRAIGTGTFSAPDSAALEQVDVIAVSATRGIAQRGRERLAAFVRAGGGLLVAAGPNVEADVLRQALDGLVETSWSSRPASPLTFAPDDARHPVFRVFGGVGTLGHVAFTRTVEIAASPRASVIARFSDGSPALVEERGGPGRVLVFASDLNHRWNDFPLQPAFVPFVHEMFRYLAASRASRSEYLVGEVEAAAAPGIATIGGRRVAVNIDPRESDPARITLQAFQDGLFSSEGAGSGSTLAARGQQEDSQFLWWYGLLAMTISLAAEGMLGRRLG